jgi:hypothetical protein
MKSLKKLLAVTVALLCMASGSAAALPQLRNDQNLPIGQKSPASKSAPNIIVTSIAGSMLLNDAEIYNQTDTPIQLDGWKLAFTVSGCPADNTVQISFPKGWILAKHHLTFQRVLAPQTQYSQAASFILSNTSFTQNCSNPHLANISVYTNDQKLDQFINITPNILTKTNVALQHQRDNSPRSTRTMSGNFTDDYDIVSTEDIDDNSKLTLYSSPLYSPPKTSHGLRILEILPRAKDCSPIDHSLACNDYVKLYNPTNQPINLANYRLRIGSKGQNTSISNTFTWNESLDPGQQDELWLDPGAYFTLTMRNDGQPLSITNSGDYVWAEDSYGVKIYQPVIKYPSASSTKRIGEAWTLDGQTWRWTTAPRPNGANYFPRAAEAPAKTATNDHRYKPCDADQFRNPATHRCKLKASLITHLKPCDPDQFRNPDTNRCKLKTSTSSSQVKPCDADQYRNPATNRCKLKVSASSHHLKPCDPNQFRNPKTNRCKLKSSAGATHYKPCQAGWHRNPETHRCRKGAHVKGAAITSVQDVQTPSKTSHIRWLFGGAVIAAALVYALYERRDDVFVKLLPLRQHFSKSSKI